MVHSQGTAGTAPRPGCECGLCQERRASLRSMHAGLTRQRDRDALRAEFDLADALEVRGFWYLGTPFTKYRAGIDDAYMMAAAITSILTALGVPLYCPIAQHCDRFANLAGNDLKDVEFWMRVTAPLRRAACGLIVAELHGWELSQGLQQERSEFFAEGKPVYHLNRVALAKLGELLKARKR